jgi:hypothetical protein
MPKILIVSKTRMNNNRVCVGGIDLDKSISVRLLDRNRNHEFEKDCLYKIREIYDIEYTHEPRQLPHSEDIRVLQKKKIDELNQAWSILDILRKQNIQIYSGNIRVTFEGKLNLTEGGALYISEENVPQYSTCFWICDREIRRHDFNEKIRYNYNDNTRQWGYNIPFVGLEENPAQIISRGTLIRLSLATWWKPENSEVEERCYLQLSGWY